jgi:hypothetical protein
MSGSTVTAAGPLWAITSYFNSQRYHRRRANFRIFRERLSLPLVAVELSFDGRFDLGSRDAEVLIRRRGHDVLWQKERLLNLALDALPSSCEQVVWVDCDVVFQRDDWASEVSRRLRDVSLLQPFSQVRHLPPDAQIDDLTAAQPIFEQIATTALVAAGHSPEAWIGKALGRGPQSPAPGLAWAARRELLEQHGFYDACVIGGGDNALISAAYGVFQQIINFHKLNDRQQSRYLAWAGRFHHSVRGEVACVEGGLLHLWHGSMEDRQTRERHQKLANCDFDPFTDIAVDQSGCWRWNSVKPVLHALLKEYFAARQEDGPSAAGEDGQSNPVRPRLAA